MTVVHGRENLLIISSCTSHINCMRLNILYCVTVNCQLTGTINVRLAWHTYRTNGRPPLPDGRSTPTRQGQPRKRDVWRKHEAEPMYVANSEPAIWRWGEGRAAVEERDLISGSIEP